MATMEELYQQYLLTQPGIGGSQNRYRDLMSQMRPFANPYPGSTGLLAGGTVAPVVPKTPAKTNPMGTYGGGGLGSSETTPSGWDTMTDAEKATYYGENPTMAAVTRAAQGIFANTVYGRAQNYFDPDFVNRQGLIAMGVDPAAYQAARENFRQSEIRAMNDAQAQAEAESARQAAQEGFRSSEITAMNEAAAQAAAAQAANATNVPSQAEVQAAFAAAMSNFTANQAAEAAATESARQAAQEGFRSSEISAMNDAAQAEATESARQAAQEGFRSSEIAAMNAAAAAGGGDFGGAGYEGGMFGGAESGDVGFSKGGKVTKNRLKGPDPKGPDEGYGALLGGEFVIKKSSVKKYGEGLLGMINEGKIPVSKMKSLLG